MKQNLKAILSAFVLMILVFSIHGCTYDEGDDVAQASFDLMTTQEKAMHDKAMEMYNQSRLRSVREAVGKRGVKPAENQIPFIDISNIIKFCNENILVPSEVRSDTDGQLKAKKAKFSGQDYNWYKKIIKEATGEDYVQPLEEKKPSPVQEEKIVFDRQLEVIEEEEIEEVVNQNNLLPLDEYDDIGFLARGCDSAIAIVDKAASNDRPLTIQDKVDITYQKSICETKNLNDNL